MPSGLAEGGGHLIARIESTDGSWCWETAATGADAAATPVRPSTPFHLASLTKMCTAALVLQLAAHGPPSVDGPVTAHLPAELTDRLHVFDGHDRTAAITVGHLLAHASGLPDYFTDAPRGRSSLAARLTSGGDEAWTVADVADQVRRLRPHFAPQDLDARRVKVRYSDTNYQLLGAIVETTTFAAALRGELLEPLGLHHTGWPAPMPLPSTPSRRRYGTELANLTCHSRSVLWDRTVDSSARAPTPWASCDSAQRREVTALSAALQLVKARSRAHARERARSRRYGRVVPVLESAASNAGIVDRCVAGFDT